MAVKRSYSSARRNAQARETRQAILAAALDLFVAHGYTATSVAAVAQRAGVAVQTVYAVFGNKRELMRQLIEATITGDDDPTPVTDRDESRAVANEPDPHRRVQLDAAAGRSIVERVAPIARVAAEAAASDPALAAMMESVKAARRDEMLHAAEALAGPEALSLPSDELAATLYVLYSPQVADMLMKDHGWSPQRYEAWLARMLLESVLGLRSPRRSGEGGDR